MVLDYPDWTEKVNIIGTDIMVAMDLQGSYIMMPIDIQGQIDDLNININIAASAVTLNVDIKTATAKVNVNISSQTANINVDIKAVTATINVTVTGTANINITTQSVGLFTQAEWAAKEGTDVEVYDQALDVVSGGTVSKEYEVPANTTLFVTHFSGRCIKHGIGESANLELCWGYIYDVEDTKSYAPIGGNVGFATSFSKPIRFEAGHHIQFILQNRSGHNSDLNVGANGYEIYVAP